MISIRKRYQTIYQIKILGSGTYGQVVKAKLKGSKITRAIKIIPKSKVKNPDRFKREIEIMRTLVCFKLK